MLAQFWGGCGPGRGIKMPEVVGAEQPAAGGASASEAEADSEEGAEHPAVPTRCVLNRPEGEAVVSSGRKGISEQPGVGRKWSCGGRRRKWSCRWKTEEDGDWLDGIDPAKCGWRVRSGGVLTYNFHGIDALQNWCSGKKVSTRWKFRSNRSVSGGFAKFRRLLRKQDPITAFREMGLGEDPCRETCGCQACRAQAHGAGRPADRGEGGCAKPNPVLQRRRTASILSRRFGSAASE